MIDIRRFIFQLSVVLVPLLLASVTASCNSATKFPADTLSLTDEIALLRASVARDRSAIFNAVENKPSESISEDDDIDQEYPGIRTVEEQNRWPVRSDTELTRAESSSLETSLVSLNAVNLPLNALLYSLAEEVGLQLLLEGVHDHAVTLRVTEKPIGEILSSLAQQVPFRWQISEEKIFVAPDRPYLKTYPVNYLNLTRQMQGSVGLATQVGSINLSPDGAGNNGFSNSSQSLIENQSQHAFWESLIDGLNSLFVGNESSPIDISVNRDASLVSVKANTRQHADIEHYLHEIEKSTQRQVLIEATVVEINLSDEFSAGIDWRMLGDGSSSVSAAQVFHGKPDVNAGSANTLSAPSALVSAIHHSNTLGKITATLNLLNQFGDVKILSRPQIIAINNQSAVLKVVDNRVYFTMKVERSSREGQDELTTETEIHTVPVGLVMSVTPFIAEDNSVVLNVRPTISRILGFVNDPNPELAIARVKNGVPEIQVREMESVLRVGSGQIAMIGGLMQEQQLRDQSGVPWLDRMPILGSLFSHQGHRTGTTELLVFLQPTVLNDGDLSR